jgi:hypothetical protein
MNSDFTGYNCITCNTGYYSFNGVCQLCSYSEMISNGEETYTTVGTNGAGCLTCSNSSVCTSCGLSTYLNVASTEMATCDNCPV